MVRMMLAELGAWFVEFWVWGFKFPFFLLFGCDVTSM
jgi:hypothetical protein